MASFNGTNLPLTNVSGSFQVYCTPIRQRIDDKPVTGEQNWDELPPDSALEGLLLPKPPGKDYRLLKIVTQPATSVQIARPGNDYAPVLNSPPKPPAKATPA